MLLMRGGAILRMETVGIRGTMQMGAKVRP
jgi:hypothetical protein